MAGTPVVKVPGVTVALSGQEYVIPPLSLGALEQLQERLKGLTGDISDKEQIGTMIDAVHSSLRRNYPDMTREQVADLMDLENMEEAFAACMRVSRLNQTGAPIKGEAAPPTV